MLARTERLTSLDLLRSLAIFLVFCFHFPKDHGHRLFGLFGQFGWTGVDLFFVLSGFLIGNQIFSELRLTNHFRLGRFFGRRLLRTLPNYYVVLALYFLVPGFGEADSLPPLWKFLTFTQNFGLVASAFSHAWSLCIEEQFYLVLPLAAMWLARAKSLVLPAIGLVFVAGLVSRFLAWQIFSAAPSQDAMWDPFMRLLYYPTWSRLDGLLLGVIVALIKNFRPVTWSRIQGRANLILLAGIGVVGAALMIFDNRLSFAASLIGLPLLSFGFALLVTSGLSARSWLQRIKIPGVSMIATLSYAFYLIHKAAVHAVAKFMLNNSLESRPLFVALSLIASLIAAALLYLTIERPFLKLRTAPQKVPGPISSNTFEDIGPGTA